MSTATKSTKMQPRVAWNAIRKLIADPEDTAQVFTIVRAMSGPSLRNGYERFRKSPWGRRVLAEERDLLDTLRDRAALRAQPAGSLAAAYLAFVESENLSADGLVDASATDEEHWADPGIERYGKRLRDQHDLWHTLTGYGRDELGELCLLAFTYAQTRNRGIGLIVLVGAYKLRKALGKGVVRAALRGYRDGRRARWLPEQPWETLLQEPLENVRGRLGIQEPIPYRALRHQLATVASSAA
jgi:ubiquinone biosynthesis protein COQ4